MQDKDEFAKRRAEILSWMQPESVAVLFAAKVANRNSDVNYPFRQESFFYYLTGYQEAEAVLVLMKTKTSQSSIFFVLPNDPMIEQWEGKRVGLQGVIDDYKADFAFPTHQFQEKLVNYLSGKQVVYALWGLSIEQDQLILSALQAVKQKGRDGVTAPAQLMSLAPEVSAMRRIKSESELSSMRYAARVSAQAHARLMKYCRPGQYEYQLEAEFLHEIVKQGCRQQAYPAIIGAGGNTCILHYTQNEAQIKDGVLVLVDAGAEYQHYAADITRTFPANGVFSAEQKALYEVVLAAQLAALKEVKPGSLWSTQQQVITEVLTAGLLDLKLLSGSLEQCLEEKAYQAFYMHKNGHWLGLDVHDVGLYKRDHHWETLQEDMVLTVEPGLYIGKNPHVDEKWWDIGIRIEDDVVVTQTGHEVLSAQVPKTVEEIEALMQE